MRHFNILPIFIATALLVGCGGDDYSTVELKHYALDNVAGVLARSMVELDDMVTYDGGGSFKIRTDDSIVITLFETGDIDIEKARLIYQAMVRTENLDGKVYLEMWCCFDNKGEYFSRDLKTPLSGTVEWASEETPFFLQKGQNPDNVKLNLVITGPGTIWIDDIRLLKAPLM